MEHCAICDESFSDIVTHEKLFHRHFVCHKCKKSFFWHESILTHIKSEHGKKKDEDVSLFKSELADSSSRNIDILRPFLFGWRREVVYRAQTRRRKSALKCDVYYLPPQDGHHQTREAKRKRRSQADQERYFKDFPDENLSIKNFSYAKRPLGLKNAAYETVRKSGPTGLQAY